MGIRHPSYIARAVISFGVMGSPVCASIFLATALKDNFFEAVILPLREYRKLLEDLDDLAAVAERVDEDTVFHTMVVAAKQ